MVRRVLTISETRGRHYRNMDISCILNMPTEPPAHLKSINTHNMVSTHMEQNEDLISHRHTDIWQPWSKTGYIKWTLEQKSHTFWLTCFSAVILKQDILEAADFNGIDQPQLSVMTTNMCMKQYVDPQLYLCAHKDKCAFFSKLCVHTVLFITPAFTMVHFHSHREAHA